MRLSKKALSTQVALLVVFSLTASSVITACSNPADNAEVRSEQKTMPANVQDEAKAEAAGMIDANEHDHNESAKVELERTDLAHTNLQSTDLAHTDLEQHHKTAVVADDDAIDADIHEDEILGDEAVETDVEILDGTEQEEHLSTY